MTIYGINRSEIDKGDIWNTVEVTDNGHPRDWLNITHVQMTVIRRGFLSPFERACLMPDRNTTILAGIDRFSL